MDMNCNIIVYAHLVVYVNCGDCRFQRMRNALGMKVNVRANGALVG